MTNTTDWRKEIEGYDSTMDEGFRVFHIPERDLVTLFTETEKKVILDCLNVVPLRSDWDDDVRVTAQMVIDTTHENIKSLLPEELNKK